MRSNMICIVYSCQGAEGYQPFASPPQSSSLHVPLDVSDASNRRSMYRVKWDIDSGLLEFHKAVWSSSSYSSVACVGFACRRRASLMHDNDLLLVNRGQAWAS